MAKWIKAVFGFLAAAAAVGAAAYVVYRFLTCKNELQTADCIECDCGTEFEVE